MGHRHKGLPISCVLNKKLVCRNERVRLISLYRTVQKAFRHVVPFLCGSRV